MGLGMAAAIAVSVVSSFIQLILVLGVALHFFFIGCHCCWLFVLLGNAPSPPKTGSEEETLTFQTQEECVGRINRDRKKSQKRPLELQSVERGC